MLHKDLLANSTLEDDKPAGETFVFEGCTVIQTHLNDCLEIHVDTWMITVLKFTTSLLWSASGQKMKNMKDCFYKPVSLDNHDKLVLVGWIGWEKQRIEKNLKKESDVVYLFLMLSTVLTRTCALSCLTSEKNNPFLKGVNLQLIPSDLCTSDLAIVELSYVTLYLPWTLCRDRMFAMPLG